jgi:nitrite reductase/ring-hydroxylating ferredoxin subunit
MTIQETQLGMGTDNSARSTVHTEPQPEAERSAEQKPAALQLGEFRASQLPPGAALLLGEVAVFNVAGRFCATQARCTHMGGPLNEGSLDGSTLQCPWHGARFNVCTGAVLRGPARDPLRTYRVVVEGDIAKVTEDR